MQAQKSKVVSRLADAFRAWPESLTACSKFDGDLSETSFEDFEFHYEAIRNPKVLCVASVWPVLPSF